MVKTTLTHDRSQAGFTLVELAIVMIIIGLLIGGILKGQELIQNAQVTATASQVKAIESAMTTFRDSYNAVPGDMRNQTARLPNCGAGTRCAAVVGDGNNRVDDVAVGAIQANANENTGFFIELAAADMIGGVDATSTNVATWDGQVPSAEVGGGFTVGFAPGGAAATSGLAGTLAPTVMQGHYVSIQLLPNAAANTATNLALTATQAARIDRKLDDGVANAGGVTGINGACATAGVYQESVAGTVCNLYARIQ